MTLILDNKTPRERLNIVLDKNCPMEILEIAAKYDIEEIVYMGVLHNEKCDDHLRKIISSRKPDLSFEFLSNQICNICGSKRFEKGTKGRLSNLYKKLPRCDNCGQDERQRIFRLFWDKIYSTDMKSFKLLQFSRDLSIDPNWFDGYELTLFGYSNHMNMEKIPRENETYDVVLHCHVIEHLENDRQGFNECIRILKLNGFMTFCCPAPQYLETTDEWGYPDPNWHYHYRHYGKDLVQRFTKGCPDEIFWIEWFGVDPVTHEIEWIYTVSKSKDTIDYLREKL